MLLGFAQPLSSTASWRILAGAAQPNDVLIKSADRLRVPDHGATAPALSHGLWHGSSIVARYVRVEIQPDGIAPLAIGRLMVGRAFAPEYNKEWGAGRGIIDTGSSTALPGGGFANVEGVRKGTYSWTFGDLTSEESDALYDLQKEVGETTPLLVVEDPALTPGLRNRIRYGQLRSLKPYKRRNPAQTRWEIEIEDWL